MLGINLTQHIDCCSWINTNERETKLMLILDEYYVGCVVAVYRMLSSRSLSRSELRLFIHPRMRHRMIPDDIFPQFGMIQHLKTL